MLDLSWPILGIVGVYVVWLIVGAFTTQDGRGVAELPDLHIDEDTFYDD